MIVVMAHGHSEASRRAVAEKLRENSYDVQVIIGAEKTVLAAVGGAEHHQVDFLEQLRALDEVEDVLFITRPYKLVAREYVEEPSVIEVGGVPVGGKDVVLMSGPCTVESEEMLYETARAVSRSGAAILRGGAYKPSTSPYSFQGMGEPALHLLREAADRFGLKVVTEVMDVRKVELVAQYADLLQVGTRNMQNYDLLREVGLARKPVLLKRGMSAKLEEWLLAAEYIATAGNEEIILCERGIRTFEQATRNTLDLSAVPNVKTMTHLPVIVDPSQGTGKRDIVGAMSLAAIACGADGLLIEVHPHPEQAVKDGPQSMTREGFDALVPTLRSVAQAVGRDLFEPVAPTYASVGPTFDVESEPG